MLAWFCRRLLGLPLSLLLLSFVAYHLVVYAPGGPAEMVRLCFAPNVTCQTSRYARLYERSYDLDRQWPLNYLTWLVGRADPFPPDKSWADLVNQTVPPGNDLSVIGVQIPVSGVVVGNLGNSLMLSPGAPVLDLYGSGCGESLAVLLGASIILMLVVLVQRRGRPLQPYLPAKPESPSSILCAYYHTL